MSAQTLAQGARSETQQTTQTVRPQALAAEPAFVNLRTDAVALRERVTMMSNSARTAPLQTKLNMLAAAAPLTAQRASLEAPKANQHALPMQRVLNIAHQERDSNYVDGLQEADHDIGDHDWGQITDILKSWIPLEEVKNANSAAAAVRLAIAAIGSYNEFHDEEQVVDGLDEPLLPNHDIEDDYTGAGFSVTECISLYDVMGREQFETVTGNGLATLRTIYTDHGIEMIESLSALDANHLQRVLDGIDDFSDSLTTLGLDKMLALINAGGLGNAQINLLFANMTLPHANHLDEATLHYIAARTAPQIAGLDAQWASLRPNGWLASAATVASTLALVAGGYTFQQCARIAAVHHVTAADAVLLQAATLNFGVLDAFIPEGGNYGLSNANLITVAQANVGAAFLVLRAALRPQSLALIDKQANFSRWITAVNALLTNDHYTVAVGGSVDLNGDGETWERVVTVNTAVPAAAGQFVIHYHPNAQGANIYSPDASRRHIKPVRGNRFTQRVLWAAIPATLLGFLPGGH